MLTPETYGLVIPWETINPPTGRDVTHVLRTYVPEAARIIHVETHATPLRTELRVKYTFQGQQRPALDSPRGAPTNNHPPTHQGQPGNAPWPNDPPF